MEEDCEVVISGVGGKFPEADQIDELKIKLMNKESLVTVDDRRWQIGKDGSPPAMGKVCDVEKFDSTFFGIHRRLSNFMDPQNRHILERSYEAIYDSGYNPNSLKGGNIGVFIASALNETEYLLITQKIKDGFGILGLSRAMLPNRISYFFNFKGPSTMIQNGWECGFEVLTMATRQIKEGRIEAALVGVPNLHMFSQVALNTVKMGCLTFEENTKSFDADADGYVQGEAVVMLFLQRKEDAKRVYATVVHSASTVYGARLLPFTHYCEDHIVSFLEEFYRDCQVDPKTVSFVEADGSAVKEKDITELKALSKVIGVDTEGGLLIGSVKSNVGHTEAASGIVGLVKALIALDSGTIPANICFNKLHPQVANKVKVVCEHTKLNGDLIAVNGLSFTGGMGHALLRQNPKQKQKPSYQSNNLPRLFVVSARNVLGAEIVINKVTSMPLNYEFVSLVNEVHLVDIPGHMYRTYVVHQGDNGKHVTEYAEVQTKESPVWFMFSGMGSQWPAMGKELLKIKVFADSIAKCDKVLAPKGINIYTILTDNDPKLLDDILNCFVGIACIQVALVDLLFEIGIKPDGIIGHSVGELGCAYADGCFTAEQMVLAAYARGLASVETELIVGAMAAVGIGYNDIKDRLPPTIEVACHNSSESCTISGPQEDIKCFVDELTKDGIFARMVKSANIAYHSKYIAPAAPKLLSFLNKVIPEPKPRSQKWISSSVPYSKWNTPLGQYCSPEYHTNNLLSAVLFEEASKLIPSNAICIEIAPHGLLQAIVKKSLKSCTHIPLTLRNSLCPVTFLLTAVGKMFLNNLQPDVNKLYPKVEYPVSRGTPSLASLVTWEHSENWTYGEKFRTIYSANEEKINFDLQDKKFKEICAYQINNKITVPIFSLLYLVWEKLIKISGLKISETPVIFEDVWVHEMITLSQFSSISLYVSVQQESKQFEVAVMDKDTEEVKPLISGHCSVLEDVLANPENKFLHTNSELDSSYLHIPPSDIYDIFSAYGYSFNGNFQNILGLYIRDKGVITKIKWNNSWLTFLEGLVQVATYFKLKNCEEQTFYVPLQIQKLQINPKEFLHYSEKTEVNVYVDSMLNAIYCDGIKLMGLSLKSVVNNKQDASNLLVESPVFIPHGTTQFKCVKEFLSASIQVAESNILVNCDSLIINDRKLTGSNILLIENSQDQFLYKNELQNDIKVITAQSLNQSVEMNNTIYLTIITEEAIPQSAEILNMDGFYLIQSHSVFVPDHRSIFNDFSTILHQQFDTIHLTLLKQKLCKEAVCIEAAGLSNNNLLSQIKDAVKTKATENEAIAVIFNNISLLSSVNCIQMITKEICVSQIKFAFIIGDLSTADHASYKNQFKEGLSINYYKNGLWGSVIMVNSLDNKADEIVPIPTSCNEDIEFKYISLNTNDFNFGSSLKTCPSLGPLEFSGILNGKEKLMGFVSWNPAEPRSQLTSNNDYLWQVPDSWSLEDAATVPYYFTVIYYSLKLLMKLKPYESVLIHAGFSTLGQAAITVALQQGSTVYTTFNTENQRQELLAQFPGLNDDKILQLENNWFEDQVLSRTSGKGVNVIFSTLAGESFNASLRCLSISGRFMQLNKADMELGHNMGLSFFLKNTSLYGFDAYNLFMARSEWKKALNAYVKEGIANGFVKPLKRQVHQLNSSYRDAIREVLHSNGDSKVLLSIKDKHDQIIRTPVESNKTFIIIGTGCGLWLDVLETLAKNGAHNLITIFDADYSVTSSSTHKLNKIISSYDIVIQTSSIYQLSSIQSTEEFLKNTLKLGPVDSIFITLTEKEKYYINNLDVACRKFIPDLKFICLMGVGEDVCESRLNNGFHASAVVSSSQNIHPRAVVPLLETICSQTSLHKIFILSQLTSSKIDDQDCYLRLLENCLPSSPSDLDIMNLSLHDEFCFTEVNSRSPHFADLQYSTPVFIIPGLTTDYINPLILQLMAPVFCAEFPQKIDSAAEVAKSLIVPLLKIQPNGPYNIVGETWNGSIALELARFLEDAGHYVVVILLNATPHTFQNLVRNLRSYDSIKFDQKFLSKMLNLQPTVLDQLTNSSDKDLTWDDLLSTSLRLKFSELDREEETELRSFINAVRSRILAVQKYNCRPLKQSSIAVLHSNSTSLLGSNLNELYGDNLTAYLIEEISHLKMLSSVKVADLINELFKFVF